MEEEIEKRERLRFIAQTTACNNGQECQVGIAGQTTACNNGQECQVGIAGLEICWPPSKCAPG
jgi:hypothetical protein